MGYGLRILEEGNKRGESRSRQQRARNEGEMTTLVLEELEAVVVVE